MKTRITKEWLRRRIESDPDVETEAGLPITKLEVLQAFIPDKAPQMPPRRGAETEDQKPSADVVLGTLLRQLRRRDNMDVSRLATELRVLEDELRAIENKAEAKVQSALNSDEVPVDPQRMCREVRDWLDTMDKPIVIGDGGDIVATAAKIIPVKGEGLWMDPGPLGTLGVGMPFALAAQKSNPDKRVVIIYGDGSFGLNGFEFDTAVRFNLPIIGVIGNDGAWGQMMRPQGAMLGWDRLDASLLNRTRYDKVVEALGGHGELVESPEELRPALDRAAASGKPALVNVMIRQDREFKGGIYV